MTRCGMHLTSVVFLLKTQKVSLIIRKASDKSHLRGILQNIWKVHLKIVMVINNKAFLRNFQSQEKPKEACRLNIMWYPEWDAEKWFKKKAKESLIKFEFWLSIMYQYWLFIVRNISLLYDVTNVGKLGLGYERTFCTKFTIFL